MTELQVTSTVEEREYVLEFLSTMLKDMHVEKHHAHSHLLADMLHREDIAQGLLNKLRQTPG
jgi:hypothetical protein